MTDTERKLRECEVLLDALARKLQEAIRAAERTETPPPAAKPRVGPPVRPPGAPAGGRIPGSFLIFCADCKQRSLAYVKLMDATCRHCGGIHVSKVTNKSDA